LGLETHVKHAIGLIENKILNVAQGDATTLNEIDQSTRGSNKKIASTLDLTKLGADVSATVDDAGAHPGPVGELARLVVDLGDELTGGGEDERGRVGLALTSEATALAARSGRGSLDESLRQDGEEETTSLARAGLGTSHQISATHDDRNGVLLDRSRHSVAGQLDVRDEVVVERRVGEVQDGLRNISTGGLDGDVVVLLEVDTGVLLRGVLGGSKEITLQTRVGRARNVLAVAPLTVTRATGIAATTAAAGSTTATSSRRSTTGARVAVSVGVEATTTGASAPVVRLRRRCGTRGREVAGSVPASGGTSGRRWSTSVEAGITSPSAAVETVDGSRRRTGHGRTSGGAVSRTTHLASHVRRDVGAGLAAVRAGTQVQAIHVELISHDCGRLTERVVAWLLLFVFEVNLRIGGRSC